MTGAYAATVNSKMQYAVNTWTSYAKLRLGPPKSTPCKTHARTTRRQRHRSLLQTGTGLRIPKYDLGALSARGRSGDATNNNFCGRVPCRDIVVLQRGIGPSESLAGCWPMPIVAHGGGPAVILIRTARGSRRRRLTDLRDAREGEGCRDGSLDVGRRHRRCSLDNRATYLASSGRVQPLRSIGLAKRALVNRDKTQIHFGTLDGRVPAR